jgi:hypothetical protein
VPVATETAGPRVFVSYAHESADHKAKVRLFCQFLASCGVDVRFDQEALDQRRNWNDWTTTQILRSDFVIVIASPTYRRISDGMDTPGSHGTRAEYIRLVDLLHGDSLQWQRKIIPVILPGYSHDDIPLSLMPATADYYVVDEMTPGGAAGLLRVLFQHRENSDLERLRLSVETDRAIAIGSLAGSYKDLAGAAYEALSEEIVNLSRATRTQAQHEARRSIRWSVVHLTLGLPTAVLAAVAGATALASTAGRIPAAFLALLAAAMSGAASFLGSEAKSIDAQQRAAALDTVATDARLLLAGNRADTEGLRRRVIALVDRIEAIRANDMKAASILKQRERDL